MARLSDQEIDDELQSCDGWSRQGDAIVKEFDRGDFAGSVDFVNALAPAAEDMNHHPDLEISWSKVLVKITTHSEGGLTQNDFELARKVDAAA
jgi:4a-hydroxytetrahydrobiopterin dehydratase